LKGQQEREKITRFGGNGSNDREQVLGRITHPDAAGAQAQLVVRQVAGPGFCHIALAGMIDIQHGVHGRIGRGNLEGGEVGIPEGTQFGKARRHSLGLAAAANIWLGGGKAGGLAQAGDQAAGFAGLQQTQGNEQSGEGIAAQGGLAAQLRLQEAERLPEAAIFILAKKTAAVSFIR